MKKFPNVFGTRNVLFRAVVIAAVIGFSAAALSLTACDTGGGGGGNGGTPPRVAQTEKYSGKTTDNSIYTLFITENTARYTAQAGDTYILIISKDRIIIKISSGTVTAEAGGTLTLQPYNTEETFTVTVIINEGITAITGPIKFEDDTQQVDPIAIAPVKTTPEILPDIARWWNYTDPTSKAKITHSVDNDGLCTIVVTGTAEQHGVNGNWNAYKAMAGYDYTSEKGKTYMYQFDAWTESGTRNLHIQYYYDNDKGVYLDDTVPITTTRTTYTVYGQPLPDAGIPLIFQCADKIGKLYIKILEIKEYTQSEVTVTNIPSDSVFTKYNYIRGWSKSENFGLGNRLHGDSTGWYAEGVKITGSTITIPAWSWDYEKCLSVPFREDTTFTAGDLEFELYAIKSDGNWDYYPDKYVNTASITFNTGKATINFGSQITKQ